MGRLRIVWLSMALIVASGGLVALAPSAFAQPPATFAMSPTSGPDGTVVSLHSVTPCPSSGSEVRVFFGDASSINAPPSFSAAADGSWSATFTIGGSPAVVPFAPGQTSVQVWCNRNDFATLQYASQTFNMTTSGRGYWLESNDVMGNPCPVCAATAQGIRVNVAPFGDAEYYWNGNQPSADIQLVGMAPNPATGTGYWLVGAHGEVFSYGDSSSFGSLPGNGITVNDIVGVAATSDGNGYWLVGADGGVFSFGDAQFDGSLPAEHITPAEPIVGIAATPDGMGYWLVGADGGVFSFGDAGFDGSLPAERITPAQPIVGIAATPSGKGYWLVGADGGVFSFGDASFDGSMGGKPLSSPVVGMAATSNGAGYWLAERGGDVFAFGGAPSEGSCADTCKTDNGVPASFVGIAATPKTSPG